MKVWRISCDDRKDRGKGEGEEGCGLEDEGRCWCVGSGV